jgi:hypothetical protein
MVPSGSIVDCSAMIDYLASKPSALEILTKMGRLRPFVAYLFIVQLPRGWTAG